MAAPYLTQGGGSNYLCLPDNPEFLEVVPGNQYYNSKLYGTEYEFRYNPGELGDLDQHNAPCAVCSTGARVEKIMIPAMKSCPGASWTMEYYGYLVSGAYSNWRTTHECLDVKPESVPGSFANINGAQFWFTEVECVGIACPPYKDGNELSCVVCTR